MYIDIDIVEVLCIRHQIKYVCMYATDWKKTGPPPALLGDYSDPKEHRVNIFKTQKKT